MQTPLEHIADMTGLRDRDVMDVTLVTVLMDMLRPRSVAIYKVLGEPAKQHWITRALLKVGDVTAHSDALWGDIDRLPRYEDHPMRAEALEAVREEEASVAVGSAWCQAAVRVEPH